MSEARYALIGAHLERGDAEPLQGITLFEVAPLLISAASFDPSSGLASPGTVEHVAGLRRQLLDRQTFVAIRYGASVAGASEANAKCSPLVARWHELLVRHRGAVEMTLRAVAGSGPLRPDRGTSKSGADYLRNLQRLRKDHALPDEFLKEVAATFDPLARESRWLDRQDLSREFVMLVSREKVGEAAGAASRLKEAFPAVPFVFSGPWPLEEFARSEG